MKIWVHRYQLNPRDKRFKAREGALVKAEWAIGQIGFSDLHPWPEFGEPPLMEHIKSLATVQLTPLAENTLEFNYIDREYRLNKKNAFAGQILPRSHKLLPSLETADPQKFAEWQKQGFSHIKVKMGADLKSESELLTQLVYSTTMLWRLDFNGKLKADEFTAWWNGLDPAVKARIDMVEDPTGGEQLKIGGPWANDWKKQNAAQIRIIKPARESLEILAQYDRLIFTHGMDHPLGQACAAWAAGRFYAGHPKKMDVCGLAAPDFYEQNEFSKLWYCDGPRMKPTTGFGFGFDDLLNSLNWERVL